MSNATETFPVFETRFTYTLPQVQSLAHLWKINGQDYSRTLELAFDCDGPFSKEEFNIRSACFVLEMIDKIKRVEAGDRTVFCLGHTVCVEGEGLEISERNAEVSKLWTDGILQALGNDRHRAGGI